MHDTEPKHPSSYPPSNHHAIHLYNVLFPGHNHLLTTSVDDPSLAGARVIIKVLGYQHRWLAGGYDLEIGQLKRWIAWWLGGVEWLFCPM